MHHKLTSINMESRTAICSVCGPVRFVDKGSNGKRCMTVHKEYAKRYRESKKGRKAMSEGRKRWMIKTGNMHSKRPHREHVKMQCERCGMIPVHPALIDGHHKDGDRSNNTTENIESLCPCCHRLVHLGRTDLIKPIELAANQGGVIVEVAKAAESGMREGIKEVMTSDLNAAYQLGVAMKQLEAMTKDYQAEYERAERLELELIAANQALEEWFAKDESSKVRWLAMKWNECQKANGRNEFDQTQS